MQELFGSSRIHLNFLRVAMGASGAMTVGAPYSYDDMPSGQTDSDLSHFSIEHDLTYIIPPLQQALAINPALQILANPWGPPGWMKANRLAREQERFRQAQQQRLPALRELLRPGHPGLHRAGRADRRGYPTERATDERVGHRLSWLTLPEANEEQFISQNLARALTAAGLRTKIYGNDVSWDAASYADSLAVGSAAPDLAGIACHCYFGSPGVMSQLRQTALALDQIVDECRRRSAPSGGLSSSSPRCATAPAS